MDALPDPVSQALGAFISEDDLQSFESWMRYQAVDPTALSAETLEKWRTSFDDIRARADSTPKVGRMRLQPLAAGQTLYAVALNEDSKLWLALWIRCSEKGEVFILHPGLSTHTSYHADGRMHVKSGGRKFSRCQCQPPGPGFRGAVDLGRYFGFGPKGTGAVCDPGMFTGVVEVPPGVLGPRHGGVSVVLAEPGHVPDPTVFEEFGQKVVTQRVFKERSPWVAVTIFSSR